MTLETIEWATAKVLVDQLRTALGADVDQVASHWLGDEIRGVAVWVEAIETTEMDIKLLQAGRKQVDVVFDIIFGVRVAGLGTDRDATANRLAHIQETALSSLQDDPGIGEALQLGVLWARMTDRRSMTRDLQRAGFVGLGEFTVTVTARTA